MYTFNTNTLSRWSAKQAVHSRHEIFREKERRRERMRNKIVAEGRRWGRFPAESFRNR